MNTNLCGNLDQILERHTHVIECEINKSMAAFQSLNTQISPTIVASFFDMIKSRTVETCMKMKISYLSSMDAVEQVDSLDLKQTAVLVSVETSSNFEHNPTIHRVLESTFYNIDGSVIDRHPVPIELTSKISPTEDAKSTNNSQLNQEDSQIDGSSCLTIELNGTTSPNIASFEVDDAPAVAQPAMEIAQDVPVVPTDENYSEIGNLVAAVENVTMVLNESQAVKLPENENQTECQLLDGSTDETDDLTRIPLPGEEVAVSEEQSTPDAVDKQNSNDCQPSITLDSTIDNENTSNVVDASCSTSEKEVADKEPANVEETGANVTDVEPLTPELMFEMVTAQIQAEIDQNLVPNCEITASIENTDSNDSENHSPIDMDIESDNDAEKTVSVGQKKPIDSSTIEEGEDSGSSDESLLGFDKQVAVQCENGHLKRKDQAILSFSPAKKLKPSDNGSDFEGKSSPSNVANQMIQLKKGSSIPKNTDPNVHCQNPAYQTKCVLCDEVNECLVKHYSLIHPQSDVYISRPSPSMVERLLCCSGSTVFKDGKIKGFCCFCEMPLLLCETEWKQHLLSHTGEWEFYCTNCSVQLPERMSHGTCSSDTVLSVFDDRNADGALKMFMCKWCNYIQMHRARMIQHMREHSQIDSNFNKNVNKLIFIPNLRPLTWDLSSNYQFVAESARFRCSIEKCGQCFSNSDDFERHFGENHANAVQFRCPHCTTVLEHQNHHHFAIEICKHFKCHGRCLLECCICQMQFESEFNMCSHMIRSHPSDSIMYRSIFIRSENDVEKRELTFLLACNICTARFTSITKSTEHFVSVHRSSNIDLTMIKMVKRTTVEGTTSCFTPKEKRSFKVFRWFVCKMCDRGHKTKRALIEHFNHEHRTHEIVMKLGKLMITGYDKHGDSNDTESIDGFDSNLVFYCAICRDDAEATNFAYHNAHDVHTHWLNSHAWRTDLKPFRFYAVEFVMCTHCNFISSFDEVHKHSKNAHPNDLLAISGVLNHRACCLCDYVGENLGHHLKTRHELILRSNSFNPTRFTDDTLAKLLAVNIHPKYQCCLCDDVFETIDTIQNHNFTAHKMSLNYKTFYDTQSIHLITGCCEATVGLSEFLDHLADPNHRITAGICTKCNFQASETFEFVNHQVQAHQMYKDADSLYRRLLRTRFWNTKVIFGNGLILNKHNLLGTEFDDSKPFDILVEALLAIARSNLELEPIDG